MTKRIKFNIIQSLFRLFSLLADKTGGWNVFVKPKLLLGTMILGLFSTGIVATSCSTDDGLSNCYLVVKDREKEEEDGEKPFCYMPPFPGDSDDSTTEQN